MLIMHKNTHMTHNLYFKIIFKILRFFTGREKIGTHMNEHSATVQQRPKFLLENLYFFMCTYV